MSNVKYHPELIQGSEEWQAARCGLLTASEMHLIITPTLKAARNEKERSHLYELLAQRITGYVEPRYISDDMLRGQEDEIEARALYSKKYAPVQDMGFITNEWFGGVTIGCSPDGLVGDDGMIECKSRRQKFQIDTILSVDSGAPAEYIIQIQTSLMVAEREWCDFVSYSAGLPMVTIRVYPDQRVQEAIRRAADEFEQRLTEKRWQYFGATHRADARLIPTERKVVQEMHV